MKKYFRLLALTLVVVMAMGMTGCGKKSYANLEAWYNANLETVQEVEDELNTSSPDCEVSLYVENNTIVYKFVYAEMLCDITNAEEMELVKSIFDESLDADKDTYTELIDSLAADSGVSGISVRIDIFNPGEEAAFYTKELTK